MKPNPDDTSRRIGPLVTDASRRFDREVFPRFIVHDDHVRCLLEIGLHDPVVHQHLKVVEYGQCEFGEAMVHLIRRLVDEKRYYGEWALRGGGAPQVQVAIRCDPELKEELTRLRSFVSGLNLQDHPLLVQQKQRELLAFARTEGDKKTKPAKK